jgi:voltage-dependent anion channel protein 2
MAPPSFADLGKQARDVFGKGYHFGLWKLDVKTQTSSGVEFATSGSSNQESGKVAGSLESKYKLKDYGLTFSEKWNTDNTLKSEVTIQDQIIEGLKISFDASFSPQTGGKEGHVKTSYSHEKVQFDADSSIDLAGPVVHASAVVGYQGWLAGYHFQYDTPKAKVTGNDFALGYTAGDFVLNTTVVNGNIFGGSIYQKVNANLESAVDLKWTSGQNTTNFGIACKYNLDRDASVRAKVNNSSEIGLGYQQRLREGIILNLSTQIDGKNFSNGGHKIGVALELEA